MTAGSRASAEARESAVDALKNVERGERNALDRLRETVCAYLSALADEGVTKDDAREHVRVLVGTPALADQTWLLPAAREALVELAMHWCTEVQRGR